MQSTNFVKAAILAVVLIAGFFVAIELYWRGRGFTTTHNDDKYLWALKRPSACKAKENATVFIGGSRIKFDLDIPTWKKLTGDEAVQLAIVGTPARPVLNDLANDPNFRGKLIIDVTEPQFFSLDSMRREEWGRDALDAYHNSTPAQMASAWINYGLESRLVFLEEGKFSTSSLLKDIPLPNRPGVRVFPNFPKEFGMTTDERQTFMTKKFLEDTVLQHIQQGIWRGLVLANIDKGVLAGKDLDTFLAHIKKATDKIKARGGSVIFVRPPSSGPFLEAEKKYYPRDKYWDVLLKYTDTPGVHFADYPSIANFDCPEWSHLSSEDAITYTETLVTALQQKGWTFANTKTPISSIQKP
jgi:hypothetical protein